MAESDFEFDDDPRVALFERWVIEYSISVNAEDFEREEWLSLMTAQRQENRQSSYEADEGTFLPGPTPVEFVDIYENDGALVIEMCVGGGYNVEWDPDAAELDVPTASDLGTPRPSYTNIVEQDGRYLMDGVFRSDHSCEGVELQTRTW